LEKKKKDYGAARRVIEHWMARSPADTGRTPAGIDSRIQLARLTQLDGHPDEALKMIGDLDRTGYFPAMERRALILQDLGQTNQALALAWTAHRRNPPLAAGRGLLAELFWRQGRMDDAAKALKDGPALSGAAWSLEVAPRFVAYFKLRPTEGLAAAEALMHAGFNDRSTFGTIPDALGEEGVHDFAFELQSRMRLSGAQQIESLLLAYGHLAAAKGEPVALAWLQGRVPVKDREALAILAYQEGHPELLWSMAPSHLDNERGDYQWLLRAAVCMKAGAQNEHYAETASHVDRAHGTYHVQVAKYLLGLSEESEVLALVPQSLQQRAEIYYFIGLKNEQGGHFRDAADWYLMSVESGDGSIESRWAMDRLRQWSTEGRPEDRVAPAKQPAA
jgi:tetratricopeptide (TPR) repeat protein